jgi:hypothetical protein
MMATRRLAAIFAADAIGYLRLMGDDERGTAGAVRKHREAAHRITLNANYDFPPTATSTVMIFNDRFTSIPAVAALCRNPRHQHPRHFRVKSTYAVRPNDKIRWIEDVRRDEIQHGTIDFGRSSSIRSKMNSTIRRCRRA